MVDSDSPHLACYKTDRLCEGTRSLLILFYIRHLGTRTFPYQRTMSSVESWDRRGSMGREVSSPKINKNCLEIEGYVGRSSLEPGAFEEGGILGPGVFQDLPWKMVRAGQVLAGWVAGIENV